jgi:hypothetical protein
MWVIPVHSLACRSVCLNRRQNDDQCDTGTVLHVEYEVDIADQTFVVAGAAELANRFADRELWRAWWPELNLSRTADRGSEGIRWSVTGRLIGTAEIWLEPWRDGVIVHWFVRVTRSDVKRPRDPGAVRGDLVRGHKRRIHMLKDELERTRPAGMPRTVASG